MKSTRTWPAVITAPAAVSLAAPTLAHATEVTNWNRIATNTLVAFPGPAGSAPPALQIDMAMTQGAVYDAVNAIEPRHRPYLCGSPAPASSSRFARSPSSSRR